MQMLRGKRKFEKTQETKKQFIDSRLFFFPTANEITVIEFIDKYTLVLKNK